MKEKIQKLRDDLKGLFELENNNLVLLWSGGSDSTLLLYLAREINPDVHIVQYRSDLTDEQVAFSDSVISSLDLKVITYAPVKRFFLRAENQISMISDYSIRDSFLAIIRDCIDDESVCGFDFNAAPKTDRYEFPFVYALVGWRKDDAHAVLGNYDFKEQTEIGGRLFVAPLFDWTKEEVLQASKVLNIPLNEFYSTGNERLDTGNQLCCTRCLSSDEKVFCPKVQKEIDSVKWSPEASLTEFRNRFSS